MDFQKQFRMPFGTYVQTHEETSPLNYVQPRTIGSIFLGPSNNYQGWYHFMNLNSGRQIHRRTWTALPVPVEVIKIVDSLGRRDGQHDILIFGDREDESHNENVIEEVALQDKSSNVSVMD